MIGVLKSHFGSFKEDFADWKTQTFDMRLVLMIGWILGSIILVSLTLAIIGTVLTVLLFIAVIAIINPMTTALILSVCVGLGLIAYFGNKL